MGLNSMKALFLDIGGVLLTNGWDRHMREKAAQEFGLESEEMGRRHSLMFDIYELGKITLDDYLKYVVFYQPRPFSPQEFKAFMLTQSKPYSEMIDFIKRFKNQHGLKAVVVSNEGRELSEYRIHTFKLKEYIDIFVVSSFVQLRKPDTAIYKMALDLAQVEPHQAVYIDDRPLLVEVAEHLGLRAIHHTGVESTKKILMAAD